MDRIARLARSIFSYAQKVLLPPALFCAYVFGIGPMAIAWRLRSLFSGGGAEDGGTFWKPAGSGAGELKDAEEQS